MLANFVAEIFGEIGSGILKGSVLKFITSN